MTFSEACAYIVTETSRDGDSIYSLPTSGPYYNTPFGKRLAIILASFSRDTRLLFTPSVAITLATNDWEFSFDDASNCSLRVWDVHRLWIDGERLDRRDGYESLLPTLDGLPEVARPMTFAPFKDLSILFDKKLDQAYPNSYAQGWYLHPKITSDTTKVLISDDRFDLFARYAGAFIRRNAATDEVGLARLQAIDEAAARAVKRLSSDALLRMVGTVGR